MPNDPLRVITQKLKPSEINVSEFPITGDANVSLLPAPWPSVRNLPRASAVEPVRKCACAVPILNENTPPGTVEGAGRK